MRWLGRKSIERVTGRDNAITYCRPKDTIGGGSVAGKLVVVDSAKFAVTVEIRGVDTPAAVVTVALVVMVWSASWNQSTELLSDLSKDRSISPAIHTGSCKEVIRRWFD